MDSILYQMDDTDIESLLQKLKSMNYSGAIVGPHGFGKTTLMEALKERLESDGHTIKMMRPDRGQRPRLSPEDIVFLDCAGLLNPFRMMLFKWLTRKCKGVVITSHKTGVLPTLYECRTSKELQGKIVSELANDTSDKLRAISDSLYEKYNGNIRNSLRELYDAWATDSLTQYQESP
ncbi:hypothetical protein BVX97_01885 [bacterium E08(2017)]|nr:hypothetical protein BVX97_01885 [bacterium E08(2017)]